MHHLQNYFQKCKWFFW